MGIYLYTLIPFRGRHPIWGIPILEFYPFSGFGLIVIIHPICNLGEMRPIFYIRSAGILLFILYIVVAEI
jgi:hypothetical protein